MISLIIVLETNCCLLELPSCVRVKRVKPITFYSFSKWQTCLLDGNCNIPRLVLGASTKPKNMVEYKAVELQICQIKFLSLACLFVGK